MNTNICSAIIWNITYIFRHFGDKDKRCTYEGLVLLIALYSYSLWARIQKENRAENLSPVMGRGIDSRNRVWNWVAKLHRLAGRYDNPMPTWFLDPTEGLKDTVSRDLFASGFFHGSVSPQPQSISLGKLVPMAYLPPVSLIPVVCEISWWLDGRGRVSYTVRYLRAHLFQKTELIVAHSLQCWATQSMVDSIKGLASTVSSRMMMSLKGIAGLMSGTLYSTVSKFAGTWLFLQCSRSIPQQVYFHPQ